MHPPKVYANVSTSAQQDWLYILRYITIIIRFTTNLGENRHVVSMSIDRMYHYWSFNC